MPTNNLLVHKKTIFGLAICWTVLIAVLCLVNFSKLSLPSFGVSGADKYIHFTFHFFFTLLWGYFSILKEKKIIIYKLAILFFISIGYGILIEFLQEIVTINRHADALDVLANTTGAAVGFLAFFFIKNSKQLHK